MRLQSCLHELAEPLQALALPHLPACTLAALQSTCQAMHFLLDHETGAAWLAAASQILPKGCVDGLDSHPDALSVQARLRSQAAAETEIRAGGFTAGRVAMTHQFQISCGAQLTQLTLVPM